MGYPASGTVEIPRVDEPLRKLVEDALTDPVGIKEELLQGLQGKFVRSGHMCINSWVFTPNFDAVLLIQHPRFGWTIPGGHLDPGEDAAVGAARELFEETGLNLKPVIQTPVAALGSMIPVTSEYQEHMHYCLSYAFVADKSSPLSTEEGQPAQWFSLDEEIPEGFFGDNWRVHEYAKALKERV